MKMKVKIMISKLSCVLFTGASLGFARKFSDNPEQYQRHLVLTSLIALCIWQEWGKLEKKTEVFTNEKQNN